VTGPEEGGELPVRKEAEGAPLLEAAEQPRGRGVHGVPAGDAAEPPRQLHHRQADCGQAVWYPEAGAEYPDYYVKWKNLPDLEATCENGKVRQQQVFMSDILVFSNKFMRLAAKVVLRMRI
jgi:hypothetical protein